MKINRTRLPRGLRIVVSFLISVSLLSPLGLAGRVLCFGSDGHIALETALGSSCSHGGAEGSGQGQASCDDTSHCGPCVDVTVPSTVLVNHEIRTGSNFANCQAHGVSLTWVLPGSRRRVPPVEPATESSNRHTLLSVQLLI